MTDKIDQRRNSQFSKRQILRSTGSAQISPTFLALSYFFSVFLTSSSIFVFEIQIPVNFCLQLFSPENRFTQYALIFFKMIKMVGFVFVADLVKIKRRR